MATPEERAPESDAPPVLGSVTVMVVPSEALSWEATNAVLMPAAAAGAPAPATKKDTVYAAAACRRRPANTTAPVALFTTRVTRTVHAGHAAATPAVRALAMLSTAVRLSMPVLSSKAVAGRPPS